ncbi:MAG: hypothetical protein QE484_06905 [Rhizobium sp.]|nr:hypothetical protein [Rhizobium sp.]
MNSKSLEWGAPIVALISIVLVFGELIGRSAGDHLKIATYLAIAIVALLAPKIASISIGKDGISTELKAQIEENGTNIVKTKDATLEMDEIFQTQLRQIFNEIQELKTGSSRAATTIDARTVDGPSLPPITVVNDPQKGRFGGRDAQDGYRLSASAQPSDVKGDWQKITLIVRSEDKARRLNEPVDFYLHDSFSPNHYSVPALDGEATLTVRAYGAFTAGALVGANKVPLELDLTLYQGIDVPNYWRQR